MTERPYATTPLAEFVAAVGERSPAPASGSALAVTGALAAALAELTAQLAEDDAGAAEARGVRARLLELADEDAAAYAAYLETQAPDAKSRTVDVPLELAETVSAVATLARRLDAGASRTIGGDTNAAVELADAVVRAAARLVEINAGDDGDPRVERARSLAKATR